MEKIKIWMDQIFKLGLLILFICMVMSLYTLSQNGRYQKYDNNKILDTQTGRILSFSCGWGNQPCEHSIISMEDGKTESKKWKFH